MSETKKALTFNGVKFFSAFFGGLIFIFMANRFNWYDAEYLFMFGFPLLVMFAVAVSAERRRVYTTGVGAETHARSGERRSVTETRFRKKFLRTWAVWICVPIVAGVVWWVLERVFG